MRQILLLLALLASGVSAQTVTVGQYYLTDPSGATIGPNVGRSRTIV